MERQQFISYINEPGKLDKHSLDDIEDLTKKFPYCQSLQILQLLNLHQTNNILYDEYLSSTAAHIADRKRLRELVNNLKNKNLEDLDGDLDKVFGPHVETSKPVQQTDDKAKESILPIIEQDEEARLLKLKQIVEDRLKEITADSEESPDSTKLTREEIIERFIEEEPSISRPKTKFFDPVKVAKSSREEQPGLVTETLAHIHIQQGNIDKAIEIYRKLSLTFPEKSGYFAAQIKKLSKEN